MMTSHTISSPMTPDEIAAIQPCPGWDDGREGFIWCRFDAILTPADDPRHLRAEITWDDDSDFEDNESGEPSLYFDPQLWIETNARDPNDPDRLVTFDGFKVPISTQEAFELLMSPPASILAKYADRIAGLAVAAETS